MFVLKLIGKVCVLPAIVVLAFLLGIVKVCVGIYNFARALFGLLIGALVILTVIFYQDWLQIGLLRSNTTKVRNIKKYILASLFNATTTIDSYYRAEVNHDFPQYAAAK